MEAKEIAEALPNIEEVTKRYFLYCKQNTDKEYLKFNSRIVPNDEKMVGVRIPLIRAVANPFKKQDKKIIKELINHLWSSKIYEDRVLCAYLAAFLSEWSFVFRMSKKADNWVLVDELCGHSLSPMLVDEPKHFSDLTKLTKSKNVWHRRIATVALIQWMRSNKSKTKALKILDDLMLDEEPMVKKATDWMLREWAKNENALAFDYMMKWAKKGNKHTKSVLTNASWKLSPQRKKRLRDAL